MNESIDRALLESKTIAVVGLDSRTFRPSHQIATYLQAQPEVVEMLAQIENFLKHWLPAFVEDQRSYLTVAIGCTGGQHRSVYVVETLAKRFASQAATLIRHRELDAR